MNQLGRTVAAIMDVIATRSGHYMMLEQPDFIVNANGTSSKRSASGGFDREGF